MERGEGKVDNFRRNHNADLNGNATHEPVHLPLQHHRAVADFAVFNARAGVARRPSRRARHKTDPAETAGSV